MDYVDALIMCAMIAGILIGVAYKDYFVPWWEGRMAKKRSALPDAFKDTEVQFSGRVPAIPDAIFMKLDPEFDPKKKRMQRIAMVERLESPARYPLGAITVEYLQELHKWASDHSKSCETCDYKKWGCQCKYYYDCFFFSRWAPKKVKEYSMRDYYVISMDVAWLRRHLKMCGVFYPETDTVKSSYRCPLKNFKQQHSGRIPLERAFEIASMCTYEDALRFNR
jgi:hypothetical protein